MSERQGGDGNTDAPKVDTEYGERSSTGSEGSGLRRVSEVREERESSRDSGSTDPPTTEARTGQSTGMQAGARAG